MQIKKILLIFLPISCNAVKMIKMKKNIVFLELQRQKGRLCYIMGNNLILSKIQKKK